MAETRMEEQQTQVPCPAAVGDTIWKLRTTEKERANYMESMDLDTFIGKLCRDVETLRAEVTRLESLCSGLETCAKAWSEQRDAAQADADRLRAELFKESLVPNLGPMDDVQLRRRGLEAEAAKVAPLRERLAHAERLLRRTDAFIDNSPLPIGKEACDLLMDIRLHFAGGAATAKEQEKTEGR